MTCNKIILAAWRLGRGCALGLAGCLLVACQTPAPQTGPIPAVPLPTDAHGYAIDRYVVHRLLNGTDRQTWVGQWVDAPLPEDAASLRVRLNLMVRDDRWAEAWRTVTKLQTLDPPRDQARHQTRRQWQETAAFLIDWWQDPLARRVLEICPDTEPANLHLMIRRWREAVGRDQVDAWLVERQQAARELRESAAAAGLGRRHSSHDQWYWLGARMKLLLRRD